jgi:transcriptional regulator of heat shock response
VIITQFGQVLTELFPLSEKLSRHAELRMENYFAWRLRGMDEEPEEFDELPLAEHFYRELMLRYMVRYAKVSHDEIIRSGFSNLLYSDDFKDTATLASTLSLFESPKALRHVLREAGKKTGQLSVWVGEELAPEATLVALPYKIGPRCVGAVALLGQYRSPYNQWIETLYPFVDLLTKNLTFNIYQHGLTFREAKEEELNLLMHRAPILIENKGNQKT